MVGNSKTISVEKIIYLYLVIFNFLALIMIFDYNSFIDIIITADILLIATIKVNRTLTVYLATRKE